MTTSSAPGKIILFGEHAVVYGRPALAVPVTQVQATATVLKNPRGGIWVDAPDIHLSGEISQLDPVEPLVAVIKGVLTVLEIASPPPFTLKIQSTIPIASGLGSGAAVSVASIRALSTFLKQPLPAEEISALAYEVEKLHHGTPSGIDNTVITYGQPLYFIKDRIMEVFDVKVPFTILIGDTGIPSLTKTAVTTVRKLWETQPRRVEEIFDKISGITYRARRAIETGDVTTLGPLMDENHKLLQELKVSSPELNQLVETARSAGAEGAKLSGSGIGGNMIALIKPESAKKVANALTAAGAKRTIITRIE